MLAAIIIIIFINIIIFLLYCSQLPGVAPLENTLTSNENSDFISYYIWWTIR